MVTIPEALAIALQYHQGGRLQDAEQIYRQILAVEPNQANAWHLLGAIAHQVGKHEEAVEYIGRAIELNGNDAAFHYNLAVTLKAMGKLDEAIASYSRALELQPNHAEAYNNLGIALKEQGKLNDAIACYHRVLELQPDHAKAHFNLGNALNSQGKLDEAAACFRQALARKPNYAEAHFNLGNALNTQGKLDEAVACFRQALARKPNYVEAHFNLGNALNSQGKLDEAVACFQQALARKPNYVEAHFNLGNALNSQGKLDEAAACFRQALAWKPNYPEAHNNLGAALAYQGKLGEAVACYLRALELNPDYAEAYYNLGIAFKDQGKLDDAVGCYQRSLELNSEYVEAHTNLGNALKAQGKLDEAIACYHRALELKPDFAEVHYNLGNTLNSQGKLDEAITCFRRALELKPNYADAHNNLGNALSGQGKSDEAVASLCQALELKPDFPEAHSNLGNAFKDQGKLDEAVASFRRALQPKPELAGVHSNLLMTLTFSAQSTPATLLAEHRRWAEIFQTSEAVAVPSHGNDRTPDRPLKIGYVSPDFRVHSLAGFLEPFLTQHDHSRFHITCYAQVSRPDEMTQRFQVLADTWRSIVGMTDQKVAEQIRADGIDILVDLAGHTGSNRLLVFAQKPAPVQVSYLGYPVTTGLKAIDYRLTDPYWDPPGLTEAFYMEQSVHLPEIFGCYQPPISTLEVGGLPALQAKRITFGCLNNFCKVTPATLETWAGLLRELPTSRLLLLAPRGSCRERVQGILAGQGVEAERLLWMARGPITEYYQMYGQIDMVLDPFPHNGGATTCDALWMGVPVVSLAGSTPVGRMGLSILSNMGLSELVARDTDQYVKIAVGLASDLGRLELLRSSLRERMRSSPLMDAKRLTRNVEATYRKMWHDWCNRSPHES